MNGGNVEKVSEVGLEEYEYFLTESSWLRKFKAK